MNNLLKFLAVILLSEFCVGKIFANGFGLPSQDAFATARGDAFVATADNPSAIYYNPAGIAQLDGDNLRGGVYGIYLDQSFSPPNGGSMYHNSDRLAAVPQGFYTHTFKELPLTVGLGIYAPYGGSINWSPDSSGLPFATVATQAKLTYLSFNPALALKLAPGLFIGCGVMANYADLDMEQWLNTTQVNPNEFIFKGNGWSAGYNLGALWQPIKQISFGATFRSSSPVTLNGHSEVQVPDRNSQLITLPAQMDLTFPLDAVVGVSYRPTPKWNVEFDANYTAWSSFGMTTLYQQQQPPIGVTQNIPVNLDWQDSWIYEFGVTRYFGKNWHVSAGYAFDANSVPNQYYTPLAADLDRNFFSIGAGFTRKIFNFDLTYQFGYGPSHTVTGSTPSSTPGSFADQYANGKYGFNSSALMATAGVHF